MWGLRRNYDGLPSPEKQISGTVLDYRQKQSRLISADCERYGKKLRNLERPKAEGRRNRHLRRQNSDRGVIGVTASALTG